VSQILTPTLRAALKWLSDHNGDGLFDRHGVLVASGESAPHMRATWNRLKALGFVEEYGGKTGRGRLKLTEGGRLAASKASLG